MKLQDIQNFFVQEAIRTDPRGEEAVKSDLKNRNDNYKSLPEKAKKCFDTESLTNPYYDSRIIYGNPDTEVKTIIAGIDIETAEILLTKQLINSGKKIDLILAHHPEGYAYATFPKIGYMQADILHRFGVPINIAEKIIAPRVQEVGRGVHPDNTERVSDAARLMDIPLMTAHTVADNQVAHFLQSEIDALKPQYLSDIMSFLSKQPEYEHSEKAEHNSYILSGSKNSRCGKVFVDMTGGFEGPVEIFKELACAGVGTIISMHLGKKAAEEAEKHKLNVIIAGHISSDNIGLNIMFDKLEAKAGKLEFIEISGFRRFRR